MNNELFPCLSPSLDSKFLKGIFTDFHIISAATGYRILWIFHEYYWTALFGGGHSMWGLTFPTRYQIPTPCIGSTES